MRARKRKGFQIGTFIPSSQRFLCLLQLCFVCALFVCSFVHPFNHSQQEKVEHLKKWFFELPKRDYEIAIKAYHQLENYKNLPLAEKFLQAGHFEKGWLLLGFLIPLLLLVKREGVRHAAWLLPALTFCFGVDSYLAKGSWNVHPNQTSFALEKIIPQIAENKEDASLSLALAHLELLNSSSQEEWLKTFGLKKSPLTLIAYFVWNILFAYYANRRSPKKGDEAMS